MTKIKSPQLPLTIDDQEIQLSALGLSTIRELPFG